MSELKIASDLHPETRAALLQFFEAMADKLRVAELKYGYSDGWLTESWEDECIEHMHEHIVKGDPRDVANYCLFLWKRGWKTRISDEQIANKGYRNHLAERCENLSIELTTLKAENEGLRANDARYRWLKVEHGRNILEQFFCIYDAHGWIEAEKRCDPAIDAAMQKEGGNG